MKQTISAVIAVKNEEEIIKECLTALAWVDEIIIIDNNSTDNTLKICRKFTKSIYSVKEKLLIPELQQKGIEKATKKWIIVLDADVIVPKKSAEEIKQKIQSNYDGFYLIHKNYFLGKPLKCHFKSHKILKLFRNGKAYFEGKASHEDIYFIGNKVGIINSYLIHYAHPSINTFIRKINLYSSQDAKKLFSGEKAGILHRKITSLNIYRLFIEPILYFFHFLIIRKAFLDGIRGIILSEILSIYVFLERTKLYEIKEARK